MSTLDEASKAWLDATTASREGMTRVAAGVRGRRPRPNLRRPAIVVGTVLALAAAAAFALRPGADTIERTLEASGDEPLSDEVRLVWAGQGHAAGTTRTPRLEWAQGHLDVDVTPGLGIDLRVTTDEAEVAVVGTRFTVDRDALGTRVSVEHGLVRVTCTSGAELTLPAGESGACKPIHAAPLLRRARALETTDPAAALADVDAALADAARPPLLDDELLALRIGLLHRLERGDDVVRAALAYGRGPRVDEVARLALDWAVGADRCRLLATLVTPSAAEVSARALCVEPSEHVRALPK